MCLEKWEMWPVCAAIGKMRWKAIGHPVWLVRRTEELLWSNWELGVRDAPSTLFRWRDRAAGEAAVFTWLKAGVRDQGIISVGGMRR